ncbi:MAG: helix-turn-helix transcriptional regulator [Lachnospiraceae bacterium]|nr:helix-turn-helix transcriptional regulator [Lachnospiraceae bacterium]
MSKDSKSLDPLFSNIQKRRTELQITQEAFGDMIGKSQSDVSKIETHGKNLSPADYRNIARALDVDFNFLFSTDDNPTYSRKDLQDIYDYIALTSNNISMIKDLQINISNKVEQVSRGMYYINSLFPNKKSDDMQ